MLNYFARRNDVLPDMCAFLLSCWKCWIMLNQASKKCIPFCCSVEYVEYVERFRHQVKQTQTIVSKNIQHIPHDNTFNMTAERDTVQYAPGRKTFRTPELKKGFACTILTLHCLLSICSEFLSPKLASLHWQIWTNLFCHCHLGKYRPLPNKGASRALRMTCLCPDIRVSLWFWCLRAKWVLRKVWTLRTVVKGFSRKGFWEQSVAKWSHWLRCHISFWDSVFCVATHCT